MPIGKATCKSRGFVSIPSSENACLNSVAKKFQYLNMPKIPKLLMTLKVTNAFDFFLFDWATANPQK